MYCVYCVLDWNDLLYFKTVPITNLEMVICFTTFFFSLISLALATETNWLYLRLLRLCSKHFSLSSEWRQHRRGSLWLGYFLERFFWSSFVASPKRDPNGTNGLLDLHAMHENVTKKLVSYFFISQVRRYRYLQVPLVGNVTMRMPRNMTLIYLKTFMF